MISEMNTAPVLYAVVFNLLPASLVSINSKTLNIVSTNHVWHLYVLHLSLHEPASTKTWLWMLLTTYLL